MDHGLMFVIQRQTIHKRVTHDMSEPDPDPDPDPHIVTPQCQPKEQKTTGSPGRRGIEKHGGARRSTEDH